MTADAQPLARPAGLRHLQTRAQFQALLGQPPVAKTPHFALHCWRAAPSGADSSGGGLDSAAGAAVPAASPWPHKLAGMVWLGAMTPKRWARRAVTRNAIRRQVYAVGRQLGPPLAAGAYLVRLRAAFAPQQFPSASSAALRQAVRQELMQLFDRMPAP